MRDTNFAICAEPAGSDTRSAATQLMAHALAMIDADSTISGVVGAHLQLAIDSLWQDASRDPESLDLH